jgi:succinoglycan biosynthesis transport protein ExoP
MESNQQLRGLWASRWWLGLFVVVATAATYLVSNAQTPTYRAEALAQILPRQQASGLSLTTDQLLQVTNFYAELATTRRVVHAAERELGAGRELSELDAEAEPDLLVLSLTATDEEPGEASASANAYARAFENEVAELQAAERERTLREPRERAEAIRQRLLAISPGSPEAITLTSELQPLQDRLNEEALTPSDRVRIIQAALPPDDPNSPKPVRNALLAFLLSLIVGATAIVLRNLLVDRYSSVEEAAFDLRLPALAELPRARPHQREAIEAFRKLRAQVEFAMASGRRDGAGAGSPDTQPKVILVTGPETGSGKSYVCSNLARALAADGRQVIAVDGDLRRPTLHEALGVSADEGLDELLRTGATDAWSLRVKPAELAPASRDRGGSLDVLTAGQPEGDTAEVLGTDEMAHIFEQLRTHYDFVVVDSPPVLAIVDAVVLARYSDAVLVVVDAVRSRRRNVRRSVQTLRAVEAPLLGLIFNRSKITLAEYGYYDPRVSGLERPPKRAERTG